MATVVGDRIAVRLTSILSARGIPADAVPEQSSPEPIAALELAEQRIPPRYRRAIADHPGITAWVDDLTRSGRPGPGGDVARELGRILDAPVTHLDAAFYDDKWRSPGRRPGDCPLSGPHRKIAAGAELRGQNIAMGLTGTPVRPWMRGGATVSRKL
ncbi:hypothetical protein [Streptomyces sp. CMB-StM0423]|uniref:hypothetical protein n=1 Tax=Streptomyces sp. CMB-StM0423 TaxID=2059884 RepID=UPI001F1E8C48|nr:hypothetical protein [Streptomyces sp. CMB-StM0423]